MSNTRDAKPRIIVIGAGIVGACIAWRLNDAGASVTLIDGNDAGGIASANSFGWLNATYGNPRPYFDLRMASMKEWDMLAARFDDLPFRKSGTLYAHFDRVDLSVFHKAHTEWGYEIDWVGQEQIKELEPNLVAVPERCLLAPAEGTLRVADAARFFAEQFQRQGGRFLHQTVSTIVSRGGQVTGVKIDQTDLEADHVVVAAGVATQSILSCLGIHLPMKSPTGLLVNTKPCSPKINQTVLTGGLHVQQLQDGSLLAGADFGGGQLNDHPVEGAAELMRRIRSAFHGTENVEIERYTLGHRPTPQDGMPVVGPVSETPGLYIATMHSGATLAPIVAKYVCDEILSGRSTEKLTPFRPSRFALSETVETEGR